MFKYRAKKVFLAIGIIAMGIALIALVLFVAGWALAFNIFQQSQGSPASIAVSVGGIAGITVAITESILALWRSIEKNSETNYKRAIIHAMSYSPEGWVFDSISQKIKEESKDIPDQIVKNLLDDLVMSGVLKVNLTTHNRIEYYLSKQRFMTPLDL